MPSFNSIEGKLYPAKEKSVNIRTGDIYEGPDREAVAFIANELGVTADEVIKNNLWIGTPVEDDTQLIEIARHRNMTVEQYLAANKPTPKQVAVQKEAQSKPVTHMPEPKKPEASTTLGGFYHPESNESPTTVFDKKAARK